MGGVYIPPDSLLAAVPITCEVNSCHYSQQECSSSRQANRCIASAGEGMLHVVTL